MTLSPTTSAPTPPFDAAYSGTLALIILGLVVLSLLCCGCVARSQNNDKAWLAQQNILRAKLEQMSKDRSSYTEKDIRDLKSQIEKANQGGLLIDFAESVVIPMTTNDVSNDIGQFFYHSALGRLLLLSTEQLLNLITLTLSLVVSGLTVTYINTHVVTQFVNQAHGALNITVGAAVFLIIFSVFSKQYSIFIQPRLGGTGVIERPSPALGGVFAT